MDWEAWFLQEGMPPVEPTYDLSLVAPVKAYAAEVVEGGLALAKSTHDMEAWPSLQQQLFLQELLDQSERVSLCFCHAFIFKWAMCLWRLFFVFNVDTAFMYSSVRTQI